MTTKELLQMDAPKFSVGQPVKIRHDDGTWGVAWITGIVAVYRYRIATPPDKYFPGGEIIGVLKAESDIRMLPYS